MKAHVHRCAQPERDHSGPCTCSCGATVTAVPGAPYQWVWSLADGTTAAFPGAGWRPSRLVALFDAGAR